MIPEAERVRWILRAAWSAARHAFALLATAGFSCLLWTLVYFALLLWALITDEGVGSPLSYPLGLLFIAVSVGVGWLLVILPSTLLAGWLAGRCGWGRMSRLPLGVVWMALISLVISVVLVADEGGSAVLAGAGLLWASLLLPLVVYWGTVEFWPLLAAAWNRWRKRLRGPGLP